MKTEDNANNQYLGYCHRCKKFEALNNSEGLCYNCRIADDKEVNEDE